MSFPRVTSPLLRHRLVPALAAAALAVVLGGCIFGGTGTDTPDSVTSGVLDSANSLGLTARVVDSSGHPVAGVTLAVYDTGFRPDAGKAQIGLLPDAAKALVTDLAGRVDIPLIKSGVFILEGSRGGETLLFDTLRIGNPKAAIRIDFAVRKVKAYKGKVKLASGMHVDSGAVFIRGTGRWAKVGADGSYDLGALPIDAVRMAIGMRYAATPTSVREINQTVIKHDTSIVDTTHPVTVLKDTIKYVCKDVPRDSAIKSLSPAFTAKADSIKVDTGKTVRAAAALDTIHVNAALKSCDSLPTGSVVNVRVPDTTRNPAGTKIDSVSVPFIVVNPTNPNPQFPNDVKQVVSYSQCVEMPGTERTTFAVQFLPTDSGNDLAVGDLAGACVKP